MHLVPSSMLLRPIHIKSKSDSDVKGESSLSPTGPEAACGTETSCCNEIQELAIRDEICQLTENKRPRKYVEKRILKERKVKEFLFTAP